MKRVHRKMGHKKRGKKRSIGRWLGNDSTTCRTRLESYIALQNTNAGIGAATQCLAFPLNFPLRQLDNAGVYGLLGAAVLPGMYAQLIGCFAKYRVRSLKVTYIPNYVDTAKPVTTNAEVPNVCYMYKNDIGTQRTVTESLILNAGVKPKYMEQGKQHTLVVRQLKEDRHKWINIDNIGTDPSAAAFQQFQIVSGYNTPFTGCTFYAPNLDNTVWYGRLYLQWDVVFKGFKQIA